MQDNANKIQQLDFYQSGSGINKLGYILVPLAIRQAINEIQQSSEKLKYGPYPPRKDGGYGWFINELEQDDLAKLIELNLVKRKRKITHTFN